MLIPRIKNLSLIELCLFFLLTPFVSPWPIGSDTQPFFVILIILIFFKDKRNIRLNLYSFLYVLWGLILFNFALIDLSFESLKISIPYLFVPLIFQFFVTYFHKITPKLIEKVLYFQVFGFLLQILTPYIYKPIASLILRVVKESVAQGRAFTGFSTEAGHITGLIFSYLVLILLISPKYENQRMLRKHLFICLSLILLSLSGTTISYIFLTLIFITFCYILKFLKFIVNFKTIVKIRKDFFLYFPLLTILGYFTIINYQKLYNFPFTKRFSGILNYLANDPSNLFFADLSIATRTISLLTGFISLFRYPLGSFSDANSTFSEIASSIFGYQSFDLSAGNVSSFSEALIVSGFIHLIFIILIISQSLRYSKNKLEIFTVFLGIFLHIFSFGTIFPLTWLFISYPLIIKFNKRYLVS